MRVLLPLLLGAVQVEPPRTVNGDVLGTPASFATQGPARVCMRDMEIAAGTGEAIYLRYAGIHSGMLRLVLGNRFVDFEHGEIWAKSKGQLRLVRRRDRMQVYRTSRRGKPSYILFAPDENGPGVPKPLIWISGSALTGGKDDEALLSRVTVRRASTAGCDRTYAYGWDMLFGDEPLSQEEKKR